KCASQAESCRRISGTCHGPRTRRAWYGPRFWDTSAIPPLFLHEPMSAVAGGLMQQDGDMVVWWATRIECLSAILRRVRLREIDVANEQQARQALAALRGWPNIMRGK